MAFVYEVERPSLFPNNKATSEIGPGQYLPLSSYKFEKPNSVPFGISTKRNYPFPPNKYPGPGSYNTKQVKGDQNIQNSKLNKEKESDMIEKNKNKINKLIKNKVKIIDKRNNDNENKNNLGFSTKVERFKPEYNINTPGPGTYDNKNILLAKTIEAKCNNKKEIIYKINIDRHNIYYVNRNNNQFPWNSEIYDPKKKIKKSKTLNKQKSNKNESQIIDNINNIVDYGRNKCHKKSGKNKEINNDDNNLNLTDTNINTNENITDKDNDSIHNTNSLISLKKSKTTMNFYLPDTGVKMEFSKLSKKQIKQKLEKEMKKQKSQNDIKFRISSIPSKYSAGYELDKESGKVVRKPIVTNFKIFSGEKNDSVGPGSYEINLPEIWRKTGTCWSKYLCEKEPLKKRPKSGDNTYEKNIINDNELDKNFRKIIKKRINNNKNYNHINYINNGNFPIKNIFKNYTTQQIMFKDPFAYNIIAFNEEFNKNKFPSFIFVNNVPGPGYYYDEDKSNNNIRNNKNSFSFIKKINHHHDIFKDNLEGLGPGTYFNDILNLDNSNQNIKKKKLLMQKNNSAPFLCQSKRFDYDSSLDYNDNKNKNNSNNVVNNQSYNKTNQANELQKSEYRRDMININQFPKNRKIKFPRSMAGTFYRKDMRFRENYQEENMKKSIPGPGSYINPYTRIGKSNSVKLDDKYMDIRSCRIIIEKNRINKFNKKKKDKNNLIYWLGETKEIKPGVGSYEPDKTLTIKYDINKNKKYGNNTFNSTQISNRNEIFLFQRNLSNGPGSYIKDNPVEYKQIKAAFNSTSNRFYKGGKNYIKDKIPKRSLSVIVNKLNGNNYEEGNQSNEIIVGLKEKIIKEKQNINQNIINNSNTPNIVGPGTYDFLLEAYPWVKQSYNVKFIK